MALRAAGAGVVDVIVLEHAVGHSAAAVVAPDVEALALGGAGHAEPGVMDVVAAEDEGLGVVAVDGHGIVARVEDLAALHRDVMAAPDAHAAAPALEGEPAQDEMGGVDDLDVVLRVDVVGGPGEDGTFPPRRPDHDGRGRGAVAGLLWGPLKHERRRPADRRAGARPAWHL
jgi:hypothetical protein